ncbi:MAG: phasin family protein [Proteobacteria bacterium]|nr:phasin family protein [Pseudomonadota bacterium]
MATRYCNPFAEFDFSKMLDVSKLMADFRLPGLDVESITASQRKNLEALTAANQLALEGMQAVARRQTEILRQVMDEATTAMKDVMTAGSPEDKAARQTDIAKEAMTRAVTNMRELAEMVAKSNNEAFDVINKRVADSLDEIKTMIGRRR